ncbi:MAG: hypothetical protein AAGI48_08115 [Verrucomicrobiota bacterium]
MKTIQVILAMVFLGGMVVAAEPDRDLEPQQAVRLISLLNETAEGPIEIATIIEGSVEKRGFEARHVRRVAAIHPVAEDGKRVRRVCRYDFYWNETYGWFVYEIRDGRGGDEFWIWSETKGEIVIK